MKIWTETTPSGQVESTPDRKSKVDGVQEVPPRSNQNKGAQMDSSGDREEEREPFQDRVLMLQDEIESIRELQQQKEKQRAKEDQEIIVTMRMMKNHIDQLEAENKQLTEKCEKLQKPTTQKVVRKRELEGEIRKKLDDLKNNTALVERLDEVKNEYKQLKSDYVFQQKKISSLEIEKTSLHSQIKELWEEREKLIAKCETIEHAAGLMDADESKMKKRIHELESQLERLGEQLKLSVLSSPDTDIIKSKDLQIRELEGKCLLVNQTCESLKQRMQAQSDTEEGRKKLQERVSELEIMLNDSQVQCSSQIESMKTMESQLQEKQLLEEKLNECHLLCESQAATIRRLADQLDEKTPKFNTAAAKEDAKTQKDGFSLRNNGDGFLGRKEDVVEAETFDDLIIVGTVSDVSDSDDLRMEEVLKDSDEGVEKLYLFTDDESEQGDVSPVDANSSENLDLISCSMRDLGITNKHRQMQEPLIQRHDEETMTESRTECSIDEMKDYVETLSRDVEEEVQEVSIDKMKHYVQNLRSDSDSNLIGTTEPLLQVVNEPVDARLEILHGMKRNSGRWTDRILHRKGFEKTEQLNEVMDELLANVESDGVWC